MTETTPSFDEIQAAIVRLRNSDSLGGSEKLKKFLNFVVKEALEGRGSTLRAKTVALDVYGYSVDDVSERESVVRVDAGRLRRKLDAYYSSEGKTDTILIDLPVGSYEPRFSYKLQKSDSARKQSGSLMTRQIWFGAAGAFVLTALVGFSVVSSLENNSRDSQNRQVSQKRAAIFSASPARLQAMNLAPEGRDIMFPAVEPNRLRAAKLIFKSATELDPTYFGGFAGTAQVHALMAQVAPNGAVREQSVREALAASDTALRLAPDAAWSQSASAFVDFVNGDCGGAQAKSANALALDANDLHLVEFDALISLFCGNFERVIKIVEDVEWDDKSGSGFVFQNALGSAKFHKGDFTGTIKAFKNAVVSGAPTGPVSSAYLMAAHYRLGDLQKARSIAEQHMKTWPKHRVDLLFQRVFKDRNFGIELSEGMIGAGWSPN